MSGLQLIIPFASAVLLAFLVFDIYRRYQYHKGTHKHLLFWGIGLAMFGLASLCDALFYLGWNEFVFFGWFLFGAMLNAAWIGQGTVLLLFRRRWVDVLSIVLALASVVALVILISTPLDPSAYQPGVSIFDQYKKILPDSAIVLRRVLLPIFNIYGTITLVGGALWSAYLFYRKRILPNRVLGNVLIAAGALAVAFAGTLSFGGRPEFHELSQLVFAILIYAGFILASRTAAVPVSEAPPQARPAA